MDTTILGNAKQRSKSSCAAKQPQSSHPPCTSEGAQPEADVFECLDQQAPPDLSGVDGTAFSAASHINIQSPVLLDVLADKPQTSQERNIPRHPQPPIHETAVMPKESEWGEW
jgi:hypothetical protein